MFTYWKQNKINNIQQEIDNTENILKDLDLKINILLSEEEYCRNKLKDLHDNLYIVENYTYRDMLDEKADDWLDGIKNS